MSFYMAYTYVLGFVLHVYVEEEKELDTCIIVYSGPPLIRTPLLPSNSVLIREVSFGEGEHYIHS